MKLTKIFYSTCIFLCALYSTSGVAGTGKADSLFHKGEYRDAAIEYDRIVYTSASSEISARAILGKVECLKQTGQYPLAKTILTGIPVNNLPDSLLFRIHYQAALCGYLAGEFGFAENEMKLLENADQFESENEEILILKILISNELHKYEQAYELCISFVNRQQVNQNIKDSNKRIFYNLYKKSKRPKIVNPEKASILSTILPGLGQCYSRFPIEGVQSFTLNLLSLSGLVYGILDKYYITGYIIGASLLQKFYYGGQARANYLARKHNYEVSKKFNSNIRETIFSIRY